MQRQSVCKLHTSTHRTGLKFDPYTVLLFHGLYSEDGEIRRGTEGEAKGSYTQIPAKATPAKRNCCGSRYV